MTSMNKDDLGKPSNVRKKRERKRLAEAGILKDSKTHIFNNQNPHITNRITDKNRNVPVHPSISIF